MKLVTEFILRQDKIFHSWYGKFIRRILMPLIPSNVRLYGILSSGAQFRYLPDDITSVLSISEAYGELIPETLRKLQPGDVFIDIGANADLWTVLAKTIQPELKAVLAFEPQPRLFNELCANIDRNSLTNVFAFPVAIGSRSGAFGMATFDGHSGRADLLEDGMGYLAMSGHTLSSMITSFQERASRMVMKIDVEGYEHEVLLSLRSVLDHDSDTVVIVEINDNHLSRFGSGRDNIYEFMSQLGFTPAIGRGGGSDHYDEVFRKIEYIAERHSSD